MVEHNLMHRKKKLNILYVYHDGLEYICKKKKINCNFYSNYTPIEFVFNVYENCNINFTCDSK
jgi:hypothetical protein